MKKLFVTTLCGLALVAGCVNSADGPTGLRTEEVQFPPFFAFSPSPGVDVMRRSSALLANKVTKKTINNATGGTISAAGIHIQIPAGALPASSMTIKLTALAGTAMAWEFEPHGTKFEKPVRVFADVLGTEAAYMQDSQASGSLGTTIGVYWTGSAGSAWPAQNFTANFQNNATGSDQIWFETDHFSGYAVAM